MSDRPSWNPRGGWPVRLGDILAPSLERFGGKGVWSEAKLRKVWRDVVGEQVSVHALVRRLRGTVLEVEVTSDTWATEFTYLTATVMTSAFPALVVPRGKLWVMGDNRTNSSDSRSFGPIRQSKVVGRAIMRVWPPGRTAFL